MALVMRLMGGLEIADPLDRVRRYCAEEYAYYDGVPVTDPDEIMPLDVIVTTAVSAFSTVSASRIRDIHRGLRPLGSLLADISRDIDLADCDDLVLERVRRLLAVAVAVRGVLVAVATKVLHRKRPSLIPMMDSVIVGYYRQASGETWLSAALEDERRAADAGIRVMELFRDDLRAVRPELDALVARLSDEGYPMTPVRALELLVWTEREPRGYYRDEASKPPAAAASAVAPVSPPSPASPVEAQLHAWAAEFAREHHLASGELRIDPPLLDDEANGLALALSDGLVTIDAAGRFRTVGAAAAKGPYNLFSRGDLPALNREYLIQIAAFAELVRNHGWVAQCVAFEHDALDIVTFDGDGSVVVAVEAKRDERLLNRMLGEMAATTPESLTVPATNAARKVAALARLRPQVFVAVAPGVRRSFDVVVDGPVPQLVPRDDIPDGGRGQYACRVCGSEDDVRGAGERDGVVPLRCDACGYRWSRVPRRPCARCGSGDVDVSAYQGWAYEDLEEAREAGWRAEWHSVDWDVYRCRHCRNVWQVGHRSP